MEVGYLIYKNFYSIDSDCEDEVTAKAAECDVKINEVQEEYNKILLCALIPNSEGCPPLDEIRSKLRKN